MPGFSFAKGNAKKLIAVPLYALGALVSVLVPRSQARWVFGSGSGIGEGSLALYRHSVRDDPHLRLDWLARDKCDLAAAATLGIRATPKSSLRGLWLTLRAGVVVVTHGFGDVNRYGTRGAFIAQLWHGIPLKLIQLDSAATVRISIPFISPQLRALLRRFYRGGYRRGISLMPAANEMVAGRLRTAFGLPDERVVVTGDPRDDVLSQGLAADRRNYARASLFGKLGIDDMAQRIVLFVPTWRDGDADPGLPKDQEWRAIDEWLIQHDSVLVVRPHPLGVGDYISGAASSKRVRMLASTQQGDLTPILSAVEILITDYSSVAFDFSLTGGPIFFIAPDVDAYSSSRGLYEPYRGFSGGRSVRSWTELLQQLERFDSDIAWASSVLEHTTTLKARHFAFTDGGNTGRVYVEIRRRLRATNGRVHR